MIVRVIGKYKLYAKGTELGLSNETAKILIDKGLVEDINTPCYKPKKEEKVKEVAPKKEAKKFKKKK